MTGRRVNWVRHWLVCFVAAATVFLLGANAERAHHVTITGNAHAVPASTHLGHETHLPN